MIPDVVGLVAAAAAAAARVALDVFATAAVRVFDLVEARRA